MLMTIDIGNTNIVIGIYKGKDLLTFWRLSTNSSKTSDEYVLQINGLIGMHNISPKDFKGAIIGSVVPHVSQVIKNALKQLCGFDALIVDGGTPLPIKNLYENPWEVGIDRLANAVGGKVKYGSPLIIVDFGTATTLDVLSKEGDYLGGAILPGPESSIEALFSKTALLPRISLDEPKTVLGKTTIQSIKSGIIYGIGGAVDNLIERIWEEIGCSTEVVATGGLAVVFSKFARKIFKTDSDLTLFGLKTIWDYNND